MHHSDHDEIEFYQTSADASSTVNMVSVALRGGSMACSALFRAQPMLLGPGHLLPLSRVCAMSHYAVASPPHAVLPLPQQVVPPNLLAVQRSPQLLMPLAKIPGARAFGIRRRPRKKNDDMKARHEAPINKNIRSRSGQVMMVDEDGSKVGVIPLDEARDRAKAADLDLVMVSKGAANDTPVVRLMNYTKRQYEKRKQMKEQKKASRQKAKPLKEIRLKAAISDHDLDVKLRQARSFLYKGHSVQMNLQRPKRHEVEMGDELLEVVVLELAEYGERKEQKKPQKQVLGYDGKPLPIPKTAFFVPLPGLREKIDRASEGLEDGDGGEL